MLIKTFCLISLCLRALEAQQRIVGGSLAEDGQFPYQVLILYRGGELFCGGALVHSEWIVSAAHCFPKQYRRSDYIVKAGTNEFISDNGVQTGIADVYIPSTYAGKCSMGDIAVARLERRLPLGGGVGVIALPPPGDVPYAEGVVSGWGWTGKSNSHFLKYLRSSVVSKWFCQPFTFYCHSEDVFCTGFALFSNPCFGDSGGAFAINGTLYGVDSRSFYKCTGHAMYVRVPYYVEQIKTMIDWPQSGPIPSDNISPFQLLRLP